MIKLLPTVYVLFSVSQVFAQEDHVDEFIRTIEKSRSEKKLIAKVYPDKTFAGSLTGYYTNENTLVLINSLADAEFAGTETLYYIINGELKKVYIMAAKLTSNDEWPKYFANHQTKDDCYSCHGYPKCIVTVITLDHTMVSSVTNNGQTKELSQEEKNRQTTEILQASKQLELLLNEL